MGRGRELGELAVGLEACATGRGRVFLISGEPGIGKSRLGEEGAALAMSRGARVLWGRCWEAGGAPAYWPWTQAMRAHLRELKADQLEHLRTQAGDLGGMLPEFRPLGETTAGVGGDPEAARFRLFEAATRFLGSIAEERPLVLVLDDLHAADTPSLFFLRFAAKAIADLPMIVLGLYRDTEVDKDNPVFEAVAELLREPITRRLPLSGLAPQEIGSFIESRTGYRSSEELIAAVHAKTAGNPLFLGEMVRLLASEGELTGTASSEVSLSVPQDVRDVLLRRLGRLSSGCVEVLTWASTLGREFDLDVLQMVAGSPGVAMLDLLEEASRSRLISDVPGSLGRLRFAHALIRDALYEEVPATRRMQMHKEVGEAIERLHEANLAPRFAELALHFSHIAPTGEFEKAVKFARAAAERATGLLAYEEAVRLCGVGLSCMEFADGSGAMMRCELLLGLGDACTKAGDEARAKEAFVDAARLAQRLEAPEQLALAALGYGGRFVWARAGTDDRVVSLLERALDALGTQHDALRARVMARLAGSLRDRPEREPREALSRQAVEIARGLRDPATLAYALDGRYAALLWPENPDDRIAIADELVRVATGSGDGEKVIQGRMYRVIALLEKGEVGAVKAELDAMQAIATTLKQRPQLWLVVVTRATIALFEGRFDEARTLIEEAWEVGKRAQASDALLSYRVQRFTLARDTGDLSDIGSEIRRSIDDYPNRPMFSCMWTYMCAEAGRREETRKMIAGFAADGFASIPLSNEWLFSLSFLAEAVAIIRDADRARLLYQALLPYAHFNGATADYISVGSIARSLGLLANTERRWGDAVRHLEDAIASNERMGARPWALRSRFDLASVLLERDQPGDSERAEQMLGEVVDEARSLGMSSLVEKAGRLLDGSRPASRTGKVPTAGTRTMFRREGEYWSIAFEADAFRIKDLKGLRYLSMLLRQPGREFHVLDLVAIESGVHGEDRIRSDDGAPVLDERAKAAYRARLEELEDQLESAERNGDSERAARAEVERDAIAAELGRALGLAGRDRPVSSDSERARAAVTRAIRTALARLRKHSAVLGRHLDLTIKTGTYCSYAPDPRAPASWTT